MKSKKMRVITLLLVVVFGLIILGSIAFSAAEADHSCSGEDCEICLTIEQCEKLISTVCLAIGAFFTAMFIGVLLMTFIGNPMSESFSACLSCVSNTGAGFGGQGSGSLYDHFNDPSKLVLSGLMIGGRLELYAVMVLILPKYWTKDY